MADSRRRMPPVSTLLPDEKRQPAPGRPQLRGCAYGSGAALYIAERQATDNRPRLVIAPGVAAAETLEDELRFFAAGRRVELYSDPEVLAYDAFSPHPDLVSRRLALLARLLDGDVDMLVVAAPSLLYRLPPAEFIRAQTLQLRTGQQRSLEALSEHLTQNGYQRVSQVAAHGEMAVRGSLIDLFPMGCDTPVRVDFFGDEIESIRAFDTDTQRSGERLESLVTLPARDFPTDEAAIRSFRGRYRERFAGNPADSLVYSDVSSGRFPGGIENYLPLFFDSTATLWDYLPADADIVATCDTSAVLDTAWSEVSERYEQCRHDIERPALTPDELFVEPARHATEIDGRAVTTLSRRELPAGENLPARKAPAVMINTHAEEPAAELQQFLDSFPDGRVLIAAESAGRREMLLDLLRSRHTNIAAIDGWAEFLQGASSISLCVAPLHEGLHLPQSGIAILAEQELFGSRTRRRRRRRARDPEAILQDLGDLLEGAPVVHEAYGVGRYRGLSHLDIDDTPADFLTLEYAGGDLLHVPVASLHLISRYTGASPEHAPLHRLGTDQWARARKKAAEQIRDVAAELLDLYATREARRGRSLQVAAGDYERFAAGFPFELTEDQAAAIDATLADLRSPQSMDRLVCGDVGFGKTEVAMRAAFAAAMSGSQVAMLAPTTLLAQQHYQNFSDRMADWPLTVEVLSRFRSGRETAAVIEQLKAGQVDIIIGTHRLLQQDISFHQLGLVIVDEEHRFGVRDKERLKTLRAEVDILTLTATPIPRTLNMALGSLRELSLITTPPETRLAIKTFVTQWQAPLIREACQRELKRGGQIYFVHNRVQDIEQQAAKLQEIVPDADIRIAHGQMRESELEQIMLDFYHRRFHILVCTSIIESGIDIPSANTIIINRADRFGLAQLHQLRGRVGRSHHKAFAYLLAPPDNVLTADAAKRLDAIEAMEDLGAGFVLATHDLEIRGAGELLGEQQTGQLQQIGFSLYTELLGRAVSAIRRGETPDLESTQRAGCELNLHLPALLPEDYMPDIQMRLSHYKRIASAPSEPELRQLQVELIDRFGMLPDPTRNLFRQARLRLRASTLGLKRVEATAGGISFEFGPQPAIDTGRLVQLIATAPDRFGFDRRQRLLLRDDLSDEEKRFDTLETLLDDWLDDADDVAEAAVSR